MKALVVCALIALASAKDAKSVSVNNSPFKAVEDPSMGMEHTITMLAERVANLEASAENNKGGADNNKTSRDEIDNLYSLVEEQQSYIDNLKQQLAQVQTVVMDAGKEIEPAFEEMGKQIENMFEKMTEFQGMVGAKADQFEKIMGEHGKYIKKAFDWMKSIQGQIVLKADKFSLNKLNLYVAGLARTCTKNTNQTANATAPQTWDPRRHHGGGGGWGHHRHHGGPGGPGGHRGWRRDMLRTASVTSTPPPTQNITAMPNKTTNKEEQTMAKKAFYMGKVYRKYKKDDYKKGDDYKNKVYSKENVYTKGNAMYQKDFMYKKDDYYKNKVYNKDTVYDKATKDYVYKKGDYKKGDDYKNKVYTKENVKSIWGTRKAKMAIA